MIETLPCFLFCFLCTVTGRDSRSIMSTMESSMDQEFFGTVRVLLISDDSWVSAPLTLASFFLSS